jgi:hypothetical protein
MKPRNIAQRHPGLWFCIRWVRSTEFSAGTSAATGYFGFDYYGKSLIYGDDMPLVLAAEHFVLEHGSGSDQAA